MKLIPKRDLTTEKAENLLVNRYITRFHGERYGLINAISKGKIESIDCQGNNLVFGSRLMNSTHEIGPDGRVLNIIATTPIDPETNPEDYMRQWMHLAEYAVPDHVSVDTFMEERVRQGYRGEGLRLSVP